MSAHRGEKTRPSSQHRGPELNGSLRPRMLTSRRAVDLLRVASAMCRTRLPR